MLIALDYTALYWGTVTDQSGQTVDIVPDNQALLGPGFQQIPIAMGAPSDVVTLDLSTKPRVLIGFAEGDPQKPYVAMWAATGNGGGAPTPTTRTINGGTVAIVGSTAIETVGSTYLGSASASHPAAQADNLLTRIQVLENLLLQGGTGHAHAIPGGGVVTGPPCTPGSPTPNPMTTPPSNTATDNGLPVTVSSQGFASGDVNVT